MQVSEKGLAFTAAREALVLTAHRDTAHLAIGFGQNDLTLKEGDTITIEQAVELFVRKSADYEADVNKVFADVELKQNHFDALFAVNYNIGGTRLRRETRLIDAVKLFRLDPSPVLRDWTAYELLHVNFDVNRQPFNLSRRCREALLFINADYGDIYTVKFWPVGKMPRVDEPEIIPMPKFRSAGAV